MRAPASQPPPKSWLAAATGTTGVAAATNSGTNPALAGETLTITATTSSTTATNITFGTGAGQVSTLNELNTALAANDLQATISTTGQINIVTSNDAASSTIGTVGGTASVFTAGAGPAPVADPNSQATRASLVAQYNNVLAQINTTAQDSSFNGVNLLNGDTLKLVFNETGKSTLSITGVTFNDAGLGLATLTSGTDFLDNNSANTVLSQLDCRQHHAARGSLEPRFEPVDRADPPGLQQEPDQRAADRFVQPDARPTPTRKRPTARRCRPASRSRCPRSRSPTSPSRACFSSCADRGNQKQTENGGGNPAVFSFLGLEGARNSRRLVGPACR